MNGWHRGPPPSIGWWPTLSLDMLGYRPPRWWDGAVWSCPVEPCVSARIAGIWAAIPTGTSDDRIRWSERPADWPKWSRT